jgi:hypothetical protein
MKILLFFNGEVLCSTLVKKFKRLTKEEKCQKENNGRREDE